MDSPLFCVATAEDIIAFALNVAEAEESLENGMQWVRNNIVVIALLSTKMPSQKLPTHSHKECTILSSGSQTKRGQGACQLAKKMVSCSSSRFTNAAPTGTRHLAESLVRACACHFFCTPLSKATSIRPPPLPARLPREMSDAEDSKDSYCRHILQIPMGERR